MNNKPLKLQYHEEKKIEELLKERRTTLDEIKLKTLLIKTWIEHQPHLPQGCLEEKMIENYLWSCKCSIEKTKQKLDAYFSIRNQLPEIFKDRDPCSDSVKINSQAIKSAVLPQLTKEGYRVFLCAFTEVPNFDFISCCKEFVNTCDVWLLEETMPIGQYIILDGKNATMRHAFQVQAGIFKKLVYFMQSVIPNRIKGIYLINAPYFVDFVKTTILPMLSNKMKDKIHIFYGDHTELDNLMDKKILPKEYGGEEESIDNLIDAWRKTMESHREWLINEGIMASDERKRPRKDNYISENLQFGINGSFKKLEID